jgi:hypothetical protein
VFRTLPVILQAEARARCDQDALDLEPLAAVQLLIEAPRTVDPAVEQREVLVLVAHRGHELLEALGLVAVPRGGKQIDYRPA